MVTSTERQVTLTSRAGSVALRVPAFITEQILNKETGVQDVIGRRLLDFIGKLEKIAVSNRELMFCSMQKLESFTRDFLEVGVQLRRFIDDFSRYQSAIPDVREARDTVATAFAWHIIDEIAHIERACPELFERGAGEPDVYRRKLAKAFGVVRNELQKAFAFLLANDPRNTYRVNGPRTQKDILFRQFKRDVEVTEQLYTAIRRLDRYMRGAIIPSDLLEVTAERIETEQSITYILGSEEYAAFINALTDEVLEQLLPEVEAVVNLEGVWYDDFENLERKTEQIAAAFIAFREQYRERRRLREEVARQSDGVDVLEVFNTLDFPAVAQRLRGLNQALVDLEGTLLQWERGVSKRAFAREEWREEEPLERRTGGLVGYRGGS